MRNKMLAAAAMMTLGACTTLLVETTESAPPNERLVGIWDVALYFSPDAPASSTVLEITDVGEDGALEGEFYQSPFESGQYTTRDNVVIISIVTSDGSGPYATSGRLYPDGRFEGQTLSTGRGFLMPWTAARR